MPSTHLGTWACGDTPANVALQLHINVSLNRPPDRTWRRPPGRPRNKWLDQLRSDSTRPAGDVQLSTVDMVVQRRDGPRRLHDNDDDDADVASKSYIRSIREMKDLGLYRDFITKNCKCMMFFVIAVSLTKCRCRCIKRNSSQSEINPIGEG